MSFLAAVKDELNLLRNLWRKRMYVSAKTQEEVVNQFHKLYYDSNIFGKTFVDTFWMGIPILKCPLDMWIYQEMIYTLRPDLIIETGTAGGGSALYYASLFDLLGHGEVVTIDIEKNDKRPQHKRIQYIHGSSTAPEIVEKVRDLAKSKTNIMVILDSDHSMKHVLEELRLYHSFVTKGNYLIVEDSNVYGHPVFLEHGPGPMEALKEFLKTQKGFEIDRTKEKFYMTFNPSGYLRKL